MMTYVFLFAFTLCSCDISQREIPANMLDFSNRAVRLEIEKDTGYLVEVGGGKHHNILYVKAYLGAVFRVKPARFECIEGSQRCQIY